MTENALKWRQFWATVPWTEVRQVEMRLAEERGLELLECKRIEAFALASLPATTEELKP